MLRRGRILLGLALALGAVCPPAADAAPVPINPWTAAGGAAAMHGDSAASDTTPLPGPGTGAVRTRALALGGPCPTVLIGSDGLPLAVCTQVVDRRPTVFLLDPATGGRRASLRLTAGQNLFAGVYPYLDEQDRVVAVDGNGALLRIAHAQRSGGRWVLRVVERTPLRPALAAACGAGLASGAGSPGGTGNRPGGTHGAVDCGGVVGLAPDWDGRVWFATEGGVAGFAGRDGAVQTIALGAGERVANSIATAPAGTAVATDHALYLLRADASGAPRVVWRAAYDRGAARKPGKLSQGTGSTPTFFGLQLGDEYLAIVDNAAPRERLLVFETSSARQVCAEPVLTAATSGSENSPIGIGDSVVVASTYGYPYPAVPAGAGRSVPSAAPFRGGVTRIDVTGDGGGGRPIRSDSTAGSGGSGRPVRGHSTAGSGGSRCTTRWTSPVRSAAVPKLSLADGLIYTVGRHSPFGDNRAGLFDTYALTALDFETGATRASRPLAATSLYDTMQLAGNVGARRVLWQGTFSGLLRIAPR